METTVNNTNAIALPTLTFQVSPRSDKHVSAETAVALGLKNAMLHMQNAAFQLAYVNATNGRYRAAAEIMGFAATASQIKAVGPEFGKDWSKARIGMLAELIEGRSSGAKGWSKRALIGRAMAKLVSAHINGTEIKPAAVAEVEPAAETDASVETQ